MKHHQIANKLKKNISTLNSCYLYVFEQKFTENYREKMTTEKIHTRKKNHTSIFVEW